jgi:hypothetical protein
VINRCFLFNKWFFIFIIIILCLKIYFPVVWSCLKYYFLYLWRLRWSLNYRFHIIFNTLWGIFLCLIYTRFFFWYIVIILLFLINFILNLRILQTLLLKFVFIRIFITFNRIFIFFYALIIAYLWVRIII